MELNNRGVTNTNSTKLFGNLKVLMHDWTNQMCPWSIVMAEAKLNKTKTVVEMIPFLVSISYVYFLFVFIFTDLCSKQSLISLKLRVLALRLAKIGLVCVLLFLSLTHAIFVVAEATLQTPQSVCLCVCLWSQILPKVSTKPLLRPGCR